MAKPRILIQLDGDAQASVFDAVVAVDAGVEHLLQYRGVTPAQVRDLVHGAIFTRGGADLASTAIFIGGANVAAGEALLAEVKKTFFGPMRVSVLFDANGANTTAAAAVLAAARHLPLAGATATVLAGTGPVGQRAARLLARQGASVRVCSRAAEKAEAVCGELRSLVAGAKLSGHGTQSPADLEAALAGTNIIIAAGAAGVELLSAAQRESLKSLRVAIDLNAVSPLGLAGVEVTDKATERAGAFCYGALGVGGTKMKIHKTALARLFEANTHVLDAEEIFALGQALA